MESGGGDCRRAGPSSATTSSRSLTRMVSPPRAIRTYSDRRAFNCLMPTDFMREIVVTGGHLCKRAKRRSCRRQSSRVRDPLPPAGRHFPVIHPEIRNRAAGAALRSAATSRPIAASETGTELQKAGKYGASRRFTTNAGFVHSSLTSVYNCTYIRAKLKTDCEWRDAIRIISSRKASPGERRHYDESI